MKRFSERQDLIWKAPVDASSKLILLALNEYLGANNCCWPSYDTLARMTGLARRTIITKVDLLIPHIITKTARVDPDKQVNTSNLYSINWTMLERGGETSSPGVVISDHQGSETGSPGVVKPDHPDQSIDQSN